MSTHEEDLAFLKKTGQIASAPKPTAQTKKAVSYTHLTLPTKRIV